jgi:hypothetical protein
MKKVRQKIKLLLAEGSLTISKNDLNIIIYNCGAAAGTNKEVTARFHKEINRTVNE